MIPSDATRRKLHWPIFVAAAIGREARADEIENWARLSDALLLEAAYADMDGATAGFEYLARSLAFDDPTRAEALYWLGNARYIQGDIDGARSSLREGIRIAGPVRMQCLEMLGQIELEKSSVTRTPLRWSFDDPEHGFLHPSGYADKGSVRIAQEPEGDDSVLVWTTTVDVRKDDLLIVGFREPTPPPRGVRVSARSSVFDARLRAVVFDVFGRKYTTGSDSFGFTIPTERWVTLDIRLDALVPDDPAQGPLDPSYIDRLVIQDVTAYQLDSSGTNTLYLDDFEVY